MTITKEKVKLDFSKPHIAYKNKEGKRVPGVTTVLGILAKPALIPWAYKRGIDGLELYESRDKAANIGTLVHERILAYYKDYEIDNSNIAPDVWTLSDNCMDSFYEWAKPRDVKPELVEEPMVSEKYQYGGTFDILGNMDGELTLLDFKSGSGLYEEHFVQLAGYLQLIREAGHNPTKVVILNVPKSLDNTFTVKSISTDEDTMRMRFDKFVRLVEVYHLDKEIKNYAKGGIK